MMKIPLCAGLILVMFVARAFAGVTFNSLSNAVAVSSPVHNVAAVTKHVSPRCVTSQGSYLSTEFHITEDGTKLNKPVFLAPGNKTNRNQ